jgi:hypothetical protein
MSIILRELLGCIDDRSSELATLRAEVARLRKERDDMAGQLRFAIDQANRETLAASRLQAELLARTTVPTERLDFCCDHDHGETTAVLPRAALVPQRRGRRDDEDTIRTQTHGNA